MDKVDLSTYSRFHFVAKNAKSSAILLSIYNMITLQNVITAAIPIQVHTAMQLIIVPKTTAILNARPLQPTTRRQIRTVLKTTTISNARPLQSTTRHYLRTVPATSTITPLNVKD